MAITKNIYIHDDVASMIEDHNNVSQLVNNLLRGYFKMKEDPEIKLEELQSEIALKEAEYQSAQARLNERKEFEEKARIEAKEREEKERIKEEKIRLYKEEMQKWAKEKQLI